MSNLAEGAMDQNAITTSDPNLTRVRPKSRISLMVFIFGKDT